MVNVVTRFSFPFIYEKVNLQTEYKECLSKFLFHRFVCIEILVLNKATDGREVSPFIIVTYVLRFLDINKKRTYKNHSISSLGSS